MINLQTVFQDKVKHTKANQGTYAPWYQLPNHCDHQYSELSKLCYFFVNQLFYHCLLISEIPLSPKKYGGHQKVVFTTPTRRKLPEHRKESPRKEASGGVVKRS